MTTGLTWWIVFGNGLQHIDQSLRDRRNVRMRRESEATFKASPLRAIKNPVDAAGVLMHLVAMARGTPTPDQDAAIVSELRKIAEPGHDLDAKLIYIRHAATQAADADSAIYLLALLLHDKLDRAELADLERMLENVAIVHGGPTELQERLIARMIRVIFEER